MDSPGMPDDKSDDRKRVRIRIRLQPCRNELLTERLQPLEIMIGRSE